MGGGCGRICIGPPARRQPPGSLSDGEPGSRRRLGPRLPAPRHGTDRGGGHTPKGPGGLPGLTPELGRVAATWAAGQATERSQWVLELWKATEEKRAALVALKQSEETLHQVWRQVGPPWLGPLVGVPSTALLQEETPGSPAKGGRETKHRSRRKQAHAWAATNLLAWRASRTGEPPGEPLTREETSRPMVRGRSPCGQGASAEGNRETSRRREQRGPVSPTGPARGEQPQAGAPWLLTTIKQEQPGSVS